MRKSVFFSGIFAGIPIGLGYFAVSFSLGITAKKAGLSAFEGFLASFLNLASAGEYALFTAIAQGASLAEIALVTLIVNARYSLMSCALSQKFAPDAPFFHRFFVGFGITDEIFGVSVSRPGKLNPFFSYGAMIIAVPLWSLGTSLGIIAGNVLPQNIVNALSVALYGMFLAIVIPPCRKDKAIAAAVLASFSLSYVCSILPLISSISSGSRTIILTILISAVFAILRPIPDEEAEK